MTAVPTDEAHDREPAPRRAADDRSGSTEGVPSVGSPTASVRLPILRRRLTAVELDDEGWLLAGGSALSLLGLVIAAVSWPSLATDEFGSVVEGSAPWSAVGIAVAAIGGLMCVAAAAAYGVLLGQQHTRDDARD